MQFLFGDKQLRQALKSRTRELRTSNKQLQNFRTFQWIGTNDDSGNDNKYKSNRYQSYSSAVKAIKEKCNAIADWGVIFTGSIIDTRAILISGAGLEMQTLSKNKKSNAWVEEFMICNDLKGSYPIECVQSVEKEGKMLIKLFYDKDYVWKSDPKQKGMIKLRLIPWDGNDYTVVADDNDYKQYVKVTFPNGKDLEEKNFVYGKIGGPIDDPNIPVMKIWRVLSKIEDLDKCLVDIRIVNYLFGGPVADVKVETQKEADIIARAMPTNFKRRKFFIHTGDFNYKSPPMDGTTMMLKEAAVIAKVISGTTGMPVHYLGFVDEMSNRATADTLADSLNASTSFERLIVQSIWNQSLEKAIEMWNAVEGKTPIESSDYSFEILQITPEQWEQVEKVWQPARKDGLISLKTYLSQIPGVDVEEELKLLAAEAAEELAKNKELMGDFDLDDKDNPLNKDDPEFEDDKNSKKKGDKGLNIKEKKNAEEKK